MRNPKVSIIIPTYNGEKTLRKCLNSVLNQKFKDYEILVVDNNSKDNSKKIIIEFAKKNKKIKYLFEKEISRACARNNGIKNSSGEIIVMIDCDCFVLENWLKNLIKPILYLNEKVVVGDFLPSNKNYWTLKNKKYDSLLKNKNQKGKYIYIFDTKNFAISKKALEKIKVKNDYFDSSLKNAEDFDFGLKILKRFKIFYLKNSIVFHNDNESFLKWSQKQFNRAYYIYKIYKKYKKKDLILKNSMFESLKIKNNLLFPFFLISFLIKNPKDFIFILTSEIFWRFGLFFSFIGNSFKL